MAIRLLDASDPYFDAFSVLDQLDYMEGLRPTSRSKPASQFKHSPLHPLWHKHFWSARHIADNIRDRWNLRRGGNKDLRAVEKWIVDNFGDDADAWQARYADTIVRQGFEDRLQRYVTGDWIIFGKHQGRNYYLDLATHVQGKPENASRLLQRIKNGSAVEFPFLFQDSL